MIIGQLRKRIVLQRSDYYVDEVGQAIDEWKDVATVWAEVKAITGKELMLSQKEMSSTTMRVFIRYRRDINTSWRIKYHSSEAEYLNIKAVLPDDKKTYLELLCEAGVNDG